MVVDSDVVQSISAPPDAANHFFFCLFFFCFFFYLVGGMFLANFILRGCAFSASRSPTPFRGHSRCQASRPVTPGHPRDPPRD